MVESITMTRDDEPTVIAGDPPQWALKCAQGWVEKRETILAIYTISGKSALREALMQWGCQLPCLWPLLPASCCCILDFAAAYQGVVHVVTDKGLHKIHGRSGRCCALAGGLKGTTKWIDMADVGEHVRTEKPRYPFSGCAEGKPLEFMDWFTCNAGAAYVHLAPGHPVADCGQAGTRYVKGDHVDYGGEVAIHNQMRLICEDPKAVKALIEEAKEKHHKKYPKAQKWRPPNPNTGLNSYFAAQRQAKQQAGGAAPGMPYGQAYAGNSWGAGGGFTPGWGNGGIVTDSVCSGGAPTGNWGTGTEGAVAGCD